MKEQFPGFPFDSETPVELVKRRAALTFQEREISALERISDQLARLCDILAKSVNGHPATLPDIKQGSQEPMHDWENEGGSLRPKTKTAAGT